MTKTEIKEQALSQLSPEERRELAAELWESSVEDEPATIPEWHWPLVREALSPSRW